jgi:hypothetical protein
MEIKYIFVSKEKSLTQKQLLDLIIKMFNCIFEMLKDNHFDFLFEGRLENLTYDIKYLKNDSCIVTFNCERKPLASAKILSELNKTIGKGEHRKGFTIITSCDEASEYFCEKIYARFNKFERKLKELIFNIIINSFGDKWIETISKELTNEIKENLKSNKNRIVELALHEMSMFQLEQYMFAPRRTIDLEELVDCRLSSKELEGFSKEEIVKIIDTARPNSLWDNVFKNEIVIKDLHKKLTTLRKHRNLVAHCKVFSHDDYLEARRILNEIINQLDASIVRFENNELPNISFLEALGSMASYLHNFQKTYAATIGKALKEMAGLIDSIVMPKYVFDLPKINNAYFKIDALKLNNTQYSICNSISDENLVEPEEDIDTNNILDKA